MLLTTVAEPVASTLVKQRKRKGCPTSAVFHFNAFDRFCSVLFSSYAKPPRKKIVKTEAKDKICVALQISSRLDHLFFGVVRSP